MHAAPPRLRSLDLLRGLAILLMILSGMLPKTLPNWLDHGYQPHYRPDASGAWVSTLVNGLPPVDPRWKAFTWVDLVFPMFLFAMGAAIPIAMSRRLERDPSRRRAILTIAGRTVTLALFAVIVTQMTAWQLTWPNSTPDAARGRAVVGLVGTLLFFTRWKRPLHAFVSRTLGALILIALIVLGVRRGAAFTWGESDIIILVLAHTYFFSATLWVLTQHWRWARLVAVAPFLLLAHYLQLRSDAFADWRWLGDAPLALGPFFDGLRSLLNAKTWAPDAVAAWPKTWAAVANLAPLWDVSWYKYLWCVVPGTIVGDMLRDRHAALSDERLPRRTTLILAVTITAAVCVGFRHYGFPFLGAAGGRLATPWMVLPLVLPLLVAMLVVVRRSSHPTHRALVHVGATFLAVGIVLACLPSATAREGFFEGGISKGPPATLSYYATSVGLCTLLLLGLLAVFDGPHRVERPWPGLVEANGQNPLLAYFLAHSTIGALLTFSIFSRLNATVASSLWLDTAYGIAKTLLIATIVWAVTRRRIFWRA